MIVAKDIGQFIDFYTRTFDAELRVYIDEGALRHTLIDMGADFCLHPFQVTWPNEHEDGLPKMFARGHVDYFAINFLDITFFEELRKRLVSCRARKGNIRDFGMVRAMSFQDSDGMECELALWTEGDLLTMAESKVEIYET